MIDIEHLKRLGLTRDREVGEPDFGIDVVVTPSMLEAGTRAARNSELYVGDDPHSDLTIFRIYMAMERQRIIET